MSQPLSMSKIVHQRFTETFGPPRTTMGADDHWMFQSSPGNSPINLLLNGTRDQPAVWIFDPHDPLSGVHAVTISREDQVNPIIEQIQVRLKRAAESE